jgi:hypothetical protein
MTAHVIACGTLKTHSGMASERHCQNGIVNVVLQCCPAQILVILCEFKAGQN